MEHFYGRPNGRRGSVPDHLSAGDRDDYDYLAGLVNDLRWGCSVCVCPSLADAGKFFLKVLLGVLYAICGLVLAFFPIQGVEALTVLLGSFVLVYAGIGIVAAFQARPVAGWGWLLFDALVSLFVGVLILARWPSSSFWAIGTLIGVSVLMGGISRTMIAAKTWSGVTSVERTVRGVA